MQSITLVHVNFTQHLITILTQSYLKQTLILDVQIKIGTIGCESYILAQWFVSWCYQLLNVEKYSILFDLFDLLEESGVQSTLLNIKGDPTYFLRDIKLELLLIHYVNGKSQVFDICPHYTDDKHELESDLLDLHIGLLFIFKDTGQEGASFINWLIRHKKCLVYSIECSRWSIPETFVKILQGAFEDVRSYLSYIFKEVDWEFQTALQAYLKSLSCILAVILLLKESSDKVKETSSLKDYNSWINYLFFGLLVSFNIEIVQNEELLLLQSSEFWNLSRAVDREVFVVVYIIVW